MRALLKSLTASLLLFLSACAGMQPEDFAGTSPELRIEDYFQGRTLAYGIFEDRFGKLRREFKVVIDGTYDGQELVLDEDFFYKDGERSKRVWRIVKTGANSYEGRAGDVIGVAEGKAYGNALKWEYLLNLKVGDDTWKVGFDDWMYLQDDKVLVNRATVRRFGIVLGTISITFVKADEASLNS